MLTRSEVASGLNAEAMVTVAADDDVFLFDVRRMQENVLAFRLDRKVDIEVDLLLTEEERQDRDNQRYVDYYVRLGVDPAFL